PLRIFEWQRAQEKVVDKTEDRCVQPNAERERQDCNDSESGRFAELSQRETDFVHDCSQLENLFIILFATRRLDRYAKRGVRESTRRAASRRKAARRRRDKFADRAP